MNEIKEFKIEVPEGYCIDKENSTFECIKFKPKKVDYDTVAKALFEGKVGYYINNDGCAIETVDPFGCAYSDPNNCTSENQGKKLMAINKLMNVAKYLNGDWKPDWKNEHEDKWYIRVYTSNWKSPILNIEHVLGIYDTIVYFKTKELAKQAIDILGEETILLAFSTDW